MKNFDEREVQRHAGRLVKMVFDAEDMNPADYPEKNCAPC